ncbi:MAG: Rpn family recombination-promoting nuclease/putative transposase [Lachnospiraceae bacterium]|nr:Rpn family recombination-promoting nuclease/putative transposase [Lachnospiraceae bacterium]
MIQENTIDLKKELETLPKGELRYTMRNDYMFKAVLQDNEFALRGLLAALLEMSVDSIIDVETLNPIELGQAVDDKTCILDFWLPNKAHDFYSEYVFMNRKNHEIYSDKMSMRVLNLKAIEDDSIDKEPKELYEWAKFFKATTWEEIKMLAQNNEYIAGTVVRLKKLSDDEKIRMQCEARQDYERTIASYRADGIRVGRDEGIKEGDTLRLLSLIRKKLAKGKELEEIADDLEEEVNTIKPMYDVAIKFSPDYDVEKIFEEYKKVLQ